MEVGLEHYLVGSALLFALGLLGLFLRRDRGLGAVLSSGAVVTGFVLSILLVSVNGWGPPHESVANWLSVGELQVEFGLRLDPLSLLMILIVTGVASVIHIYSWGYMRVDGGISGYLA